MVSSADGQYFQGAFGEVYSSPRAASVGISCINFDLSHQQAAYKGPGIIVHNIANSNEGRHTLDCAAACFWCPENISYIIIVYDVMQGLAIQARD
jgi:hypothetical protein